MSLSPLSEITTLRTEARRREVVQPVCAEASLADRLLARTKQMRRKIETGTLGTPVWRDRQVVQNPDSLFSDQRRRG